MFIEKTCNVVVVTGNEIPRICNQDQRHRIESIRTLTETIAQNIQLMHSIKQAKSVINESLGGTQGGKLTESQGRAPALCPPR